MGIQKRAQKNLNKSQKHIQVLIQRNNSILVLSNPQRRKHYDKYGTVMDDDESEEAFFSQFESMFAGGMFGMGSDMFEDDIDLFTEMLEKDTKFMKKMF